MRRLNHFEVTNLASIAWAFVKAERVDLLFFVALAGLAERRAGEFTPQELTNTLWAFAIAGQSNLPLFAIFARVAE